MSDANGQTDAPAKTEPTALTTYRPPAWLDGERLDTCYRVAKAMMLGGFVPEGFQGKTPDETSARCLRLVMMSDAWGFNPWQLADSCYMAPGGRFGIEGKVAIAVLGRSPILDGRLSFEYGGRGVERWVVVSGTLRGETEPRTLRGTVKQWAKKRWSKKANGGKGGLIDPNPMWYEEGPGQDQKLAYVGATWWGRRYAPEVLMGAMIREEEDYGLEARLAEPEPPLLPARASVAAHPHGEPMDLETLRGIVDELRTAGAAVDGVLSRLAAEHGVTDYMEWPEAKSAELRQGVADAIAEVGA